MAEATNIFGNLTSPEPTATVEYDVNGFDPYGYNRDGYNAAGFNALGYNAEGFNATGHNMNGYTFVQQQAYEVFYNLNTEYHPEQPILEVDRDWGILVDTNNYLTSSTTISSGPLCLGDFNLK